MPRAAAIYCVLLSALLLAGATPGTAAPAADDERRVGEATFTPPAGWAVLEQPDGATRMLSPDENAMILVMSGDPFDGDLAEGFGVTWSGLLQALRLKQTEGGAPAVGRTLGFESVTTRAQLQDARGNRIAGRYALLRNGDAVVGVALVSSEATLARHAPAYEAVLQSLTLRGQRAAADDEAAPQQREEPQQVDPPATQPRPREGDALEADRLGAGRHDAEEEARPARKAADPPAPQPGTVAGVVTDGRGNVLRGTVTIELSGTTLRGERTSFELPADPETGLYSRQVPDGLYTIWARLDTRYNGRSYRLRLASADRHARFTEFPTREGVVRNFVFKPSGLEPGADDQVASSYYGGKVMLWDADGFNEGQRLAERFPGAEVVVRLEPDGPLMDGSEGKPVVLRSAVEELRHTPQFPDVPLGRYRATARLVSRDRQERVMTISPRRMGAGEAALPYGETAVVEFVQPSMFEPICTVQILLKG